MVNELPSNYTQTATARLNEIREAAGLNQKQFAELFGIKESTYSRYESGGIGKMPVPTIGEISQKYGLNPAWLLGYENVEKYMIPEKAFEKTKKVPILGSIAAGVPILAQEELIGYETVTESEHIDFCLRVKGNSMTGARIYDGDIVFVRKQSDIEHGEIAVIIIDGEEATLKRVLKAGTNIILHAENPSYQDLVFTKKDFKTLNILGKAIAFKGEVK